MNRKSIVTVLLVLSLASALFAAVSIFRNEMLKKETAALKAEMETIQQELDRQEEEKNRLMQEIEEKKPENEEWKGAYDLWQKKAQELQEILG